MRIYAGGVGAGRAQGLGKQRREEALAFLRSASSLDKGPCWHRSGWAMADWILTCEKRRRLVYGLLHFQFC